MPWYVRCSQVHRAVARMRTRISPRPGSGTENERTSSARGATSTPARIVAGTSTLIGAHCTGALRPWEGDHDRPQTAQRRSDAADPDRSLAAGRFSGFALGQLDLCATAAVRIGGPRGDVPRLRLAALRDTPRHQPADRRAVHVPELAVQPTSARRLPVVCRLASGCRSVFGAAGRAAPRWAVALALRDDHVSGVALRQHETARRDRKLHRAHQAAARPAARGHRRRHDLDQLPLAPGVGFARAVLHMHRPIRACRGAGANRLRRSGIERGPDEPAPAGRAARPHRSISLRYPAADVEHPLPHPAERDLPRRGGVPPRVFHRRPSDAHLRGGVVPDRVDALVGIDAGTTALKTGVVTLDGRLLALETEPYGLSQPEPDAAEQDGQAWWAALATTTRRALQRVGRHVQVVGVSIGGQAPTFIATDAEMRPTAPAVTWMDQRSVPVAEALYARLGHSVPVWGSWPAQAAWFSQHRPDALGRTRWFFGCPDYLTARLTRTPVMSLYVSQAEVDAGGLDTRLVPPQHDAGEVVGGVHTSAALETGLLEGTPVVSGFVDGVLGVLGSGARQPGDACMNGGTSGTFSTVCLPPLGYELLGVRVLGGGAINTSGKALDWFVQQIGPRGSAYEELLDETASVAAGADGLLFLPHLAGERSP